MAIPDDNKQVPLPTTADVQAKNEPVSRNHEKAERMDGAFRSIVWSATIPCGLVVIVTAILLGVIYSFEVGKYKGWSELQINQTQPSPRGAYAILDNLRRNGGSAAIFVRFNPTSITAIATLTGKVIPYLSGSIMALVAFFVARHIIDASKMAHAQNLLSPHQMSILIELLGGDSYGPLKTCVYYHHKEKKRWIPPIPRAFSALAAVTTLGIIIPVMDTWFSTTVTPVIITIVEKMDVPSNSKFGRGIVDPDNNCIPNLSYIGDNGAKVPCNMEYYDYTLDDLANFHHPTAWAYTLYNANEAISTVDGNSAQNTVKSYTMPNDSHQYLYLADATIDFTRDFRADTYATKTQCTPMTSACFPRVSLNNSNADAYYIGYNYTFQCNPDYIGNLTSNGASISTGLRTNSSVSTGTGFAPDASLSRLIGNNPVNVEFAAYTNPLYFGAWSLGWKNVPNDPENDPWWLDENGFYFYDIDDYYAWMLNCSTTTYKVTYDWINGAVHNWNPEKIADPEIGGLVSYPFVSGLPAAHLCLESAAMRVLRTANPSQTATLWANSFSTCAMDMLAASLDPMSTQLEQKRNNTYGATRVPLVPLFVLLGFKFVYCLAVLGLAVAAYHYTDPSESQSVKERLTIKGLAANYFCESPTDQQVAVKKVEELFQPDRTSAAPGGTEAAPPAERKIGIVQTEMGGWQFVNLAAGKVCDLAAPIIEEEVLGEARRGTFGHDEMVGAEWVGLVKE